MPDPDVLPGQRPSRASGSGPATVAVKGSNTERAPASRAADPKRPPASLFFPLFLFLGSQQRKYSIECSTAARECSIGLGADVP